VRGRIWSTRVWVATGGALVLLVGCTSTEPSDHAVTASNPAAAVAATSARAGVEPSLAPGVSLVSCASSIRGLSDPSGDYRLVVRNAALPTASVLQASDSGGTDPAARLFAKWGLVVRASATVDLQVGPGWEDRARLGWGSPAVPAAAVHVPACPAPSSSPWLVFAGGTWVAQPACVPLIVRSQGQQALVHLGVGVPCGSAGSP
jgi:hypothetical protein